MIVIDMIKDIIDMTNKTKHENERKQRKEIYKDLFNGSYENTFIIDNHHPNGLEVHDIFNTGLCIVRNKNTKKIITYKALRPSQYKRYYQALNIRYNNSTLKQCMINQSNNYNNAWVIEISLFFVVVCKRLHCGCLVWLSTQ